MLWYFLNVVSHDLCFCQADGKPKVSACIRIAVQKPLEVFLGVSCYGCIMHSGFGSESREFKQIPIRLSSDVDAFCGFYKSMF